MPPSDSVQIQAAHYDRIADEYALHYGDAFSQQYRIQFINRPLFESINLKGAKTLEAMCGSGETTRYLLQEGALVTGLDVSEREISKFKQRWTNASAVCASMLESGLPRRSRERGRQE